MNNSDSGDGTTLGGASGEATHESSKSPTIETDVEVDENGDGRVDEKDEMKQGMSVNPNNEVRYTFLKSILFALFSASIYSYITYLIPIENVKTYLLNILTFFS